MIEVKNLTKNYGKTVALDNVNLDIPRGEIIGLFGENGAGKTTLIKSVLDLIPYSGRITLDGEPITRKNIGKLSFATAEKSFFPDLNAKEHAEFYDMHFGTFRKKRFQGLMDFFDLDMKKQISKMSMGQQNQFEVIMALSQGADYIFMDEPFAGNDIFNREDFYKVLSGILEPQETVVLSTHLIEEVSNFVGRAVLIRKGKIIGDTKVEDLEEKGMSLIDYVKKTYDYHEDRVAKALFDITGEADPYED
ncbi:MAG: ABC transporter ATP-binding protein [Firmicutes bacterium]|nr:ABC transporter ATP-binding protein [Bacillota bacterium]